jgi:uncharacterized protein with gpF-like domain
MADVGVTPEGIVVAGVLAMTWEEVDAQRNLFRFADKVLVKVSFTYGRVSDLYDEVIYTREEWAKIKAALEGTTAYFSDFAGKHSETSVEFWSNVDVEEIYDREKIIEFHKLHGMSNSNLDIIGDGILQAQENGEIDDDYNKITE